jgi:predicted nucleotidyltransferase
MKQYEDSNPIFKKLLKEVNEDENLLAAVVYGSYARKEKYRDIDICLFTYPDKQPLNINTMLYYKGGFPDKLDIHFFEDLPLMVKSAVIHDGNILLDKNYDILFEICMWTIKEYEDFYPKFKMMMESK